MIESPKETEEDEVQMSNRFEEERKERSEGRGEKFLKWEMDDGR